MATLEQGSQSVARTSRRQVLEQCASAEALTLPCHVGSPFAGYIDFAKAGFEPRF